MLHDNVYKVVLDECVYNLVLHVFVDKVVPFMGKAADTRVVRLETRITISRVYKYLHLNSFGFLGRLRVSDGKKKTFLEVRLIGS